MDSSKFKMIDEHFVCLVCGRDVEPLGYSARDHCPFCLSSLHVDINPGDRLNDCHGILTAIAVEIKGDKYKIVYRCDKCHELHKNIMASDDNMELIRSLVSNPQKY